MFMLIVRKRSSGAVTAALKQNHAIATLGQAQLALQNTTTLIATARIDGH